MPIGVLNIHNGLRRPSTPETPVTPVTPDAATKLSNHR